MTTPHWKALLISNPEFIISGPLFPFEIWRIIFLQLFEASEDLQAQWIANQPITQPVFELSLLNKRLNVFRLLWVSKYWYTAARDVFFENLELESAQSLHGVRQVLTSARYLGQAIRRISLSFPTFRDTESDPRRPRPCQIHPDLETTHPQHRHTTLKVQILENRRYAYRPSQTQQRSHWQKWQGLCAEILNQCSSLQDVGITFTSDFTAQLSPRNARDYRTLFGRPDLNIGGILNGLRACKNLRQLHFIDPSPLEEYGPGLQSWTRLQSASIALSSAFTEIAKLPETAFCPPRDLEELSIHDQSDGTYPWPLESDITRCIDLKVLDLGIASLKQPNTVIAIGFLVHSYQNTLTELCLRRFQASFNHPTTEGAVTCFTDIFESFSSKEPFQRLSFPQLQTLRIMSHEPVDLFASFEARQLTQVHLGSLRGNPPITDDEDDSSAAAKEYWKRKLSVPSLGKVKTLTLSGVGHEKEDIMAASAELGIDVIIQPMPNRR